MNTNTPKRLAGDPMRHVSKYLPDRPVVAAWLVGPGDERIQVVPCPECRGKDVTLTMSREAVAMIIPELQRRCAPRSSAVCGSCGWLVEKAWHAVPLLDYGDGPMTPGVTP